MKLFFVYPELARPFRYWDWLEIGVGAAQVRHAGWDVGGFYWKSLRQTEELKRRFENLAPDVVVTLIHPDQAHHAVRLHHQLKAERPQSFTVACGLWPTLDPDAAVATNVFDALILAEWETPLGEFVRAFRSQREYGAIQNVWIRKRANEVQRQLIRPPVDVGLLPAPDRDLFPYREILQMNGGAMPIQASRSCPFQCSFCHEPVLAHIQHAGERPHRLRNAASVIGEAADLKARFAPQRFVFTDPVFPWEEDWLAEFVEEWPVRVSLPFTVTSVVEVMRTTIMQQLAKAGCDRVVLGVETGDETFRRSISNRNVGNRAILNLRNNLEVNGIELITTNMIAIPGETPELLEATVAFNQTLRPIEIRTQAFHALPRTPLAEYIAEHRIKVLERPSETPDPDISLLRLAKLTQKQLSQTYDRLCLLDSMLRSERPGRKPLGYFDVLSHFAKGKYRSPWRRTARVATWTRGGDAREVLALRAPTEIAFDFTVRAHSAIAFGIAAEPTLRGLLPPQSIQFGIKIAQDQRTLRLFKKVLIPAYDPDSRRWHDYYFPLPDVRPGPCRLIVQVWITDKDLASLEADEEIWGGWSRLCVLEQEAAARVEDLAISWGAPQLPEEEPAAVSRFIEEKPRGTAKKPAARKRTEAEERDDEDNILRLRDELKKVRAERDHLARRILALNERIELQRGDIKSIASERDAAVERAEKAEDRAARAEQQGPKRRKGS